MKRILLLGIFLLSNAGAACSSGRLYPPSEPLCSLSDPNDSYCPELYQEYNEELQEYYQVKQDYVNCVNEERMQERMQEMEERMRE